MSKIYTSRRTVLPEGVKPAILVVNNEKIEKIISSSEYETIKKELNVYIFIDQ